MRVGDELLDPAAVLVDPARLDGQEPAVPWLVADRRRRARRRGGRRPGRHRRRRAGPCSARMMSSRPCRSRRMYDRSASSCSASWRRSRSSWSVRLSRSSQEARSEHPVDPPPPPGHRLAHAVPPRAVRIVRAASRASSVVIGGRRASRASAAARSTSWALSRTGSPRRERQRVLHADAQVAAGGQRRQGHRHGRAPDAGRGPGRPGRQVADRGDQRLRRSPACRRARPSRGRSARGRRTAAPYLSSRRFIAVTWPRSKSSNSGTTSRSWVRR